MESDFGLLEVGGSDLSPSISVLFAIPDSLMAALSTCNPGAAACSHPSRCMEAIRSHSLNAIVGNRHRRRDVLPSWHSAAARRARSRTRSCRRTSGRSSARRARESSELFTANSKWILIGAFVNVTLATSQRLHLEAESVVEVPSDARLQCCMRGVPNSNATHTLDHWIT